MLTVTIAPQSVDLVIKKAAEELPWHAGIVATSGPQATVEVRFGLSDFAGLCQRGLELVAAHEREHPESGIVLPTAVETASVNAAGKKGQTR